MKEGPYALCTDGSNDEGLFKLNPLLVCLFDINEGKVVSQLLDMSTSKKNDAENLFSLIDDAIEQNGIDWYHCVAIKAVKEILHHCAKNQEKLMSQSRKKLVTDGRMDKG